MSRRRLLLWSAPVVAVLLVVSVKLLLTAHVVGQGRDAYRAGSYARAQGQFAQLGVANVYERWVAPFDRGDALYRSKSYPSARTQFELALPLAPSERKCAVRGNLALAGEQVGTVALKAKNRTGAITAYTRALRAATDGHCRSLAGRRAELQKLLALLRQKQPTAPPKSGNNDPAAPPSNSDRLRQRNERAARTQGNANDANGRQPTPNPNGKPW